MTVTASPIATRKPLLGLATLMTQAFRGTDLRPLAQALIDRAAADEDDAEALMDLSTALFLQGLREVGLATQAQALQVSRLYRLAAPCPPAQGRPLRLLALMMPGDLMTNAPLPFLCEGSDIELSMLYLLPGEPLPETLPPHDVVWTAVSESAASRPLLSRLEAQRARWGLRQVNRPGAILHTSRDEAWQMLHDVPGLLMPATALHERGVLQELAEGRRPLGTLLPDAAWPLIIRPLDSHAGHDLEKVDTPAALAGYLAATAGEAFYLSSFIDYRGADGQFRKCRVVLVGDPGRSDKPRGLARGRAFKPERLAAARCTGAGFRLVRHHKTRRSRTATTRRPGASAKDGSLRIPCAAGAMKPPSGYSPARSTRPSAGS